MTIPNCVPAAPGDSGFRPTLRKSARSVDPGFTKRAFMVLCCLLLAAISQAQSSQAGAKPNAQSSANSSVQPRTETAPRWIRYCLELGGFCFEHPPGWTYLGPVYNGAGVVFAEPNKERAKTDWNHITAATLDLPAPAEGSERPSMNELINDVMTPPKGGAMHTVERMETVVGGYPAQVVTAEVQEQGKPVATEQVAFIDADEVLYTVALRCAPADYRRLQPIFLKALKSWREMPPLPSQPGTGAAPKPDVQKLK